MAKWIAASDPWAQAIEVIRAPSHAWQTNSQHYDEYPMRLDAWLWALNEGWHLGPTANQDNHKGNWGSSES